LDVRDFRVDPKDLDVRDFYAKDLDVRDFYAILLRDFAR
jgi:hypothetical protein